MAKYYDTTAVLQVIGCVFNNPSLLDMDDKYFVTDEDFSNEFHKVVFGTIYKVHELGAKAITLQNINDYLASKPKSQGIYQAEKGDDWLLEVSTYANELTFDYYYNRLKKMTRCTKFALTSRTGRATVKSFVPHFISSGTCSS